MTPRVALERTRSHLDDRLFAEAPAGPPITVRHALIWAMIAVAATTIQLLRMWSSLPLESLWAEDGGTWLAGALAQDPLDALTTTYNGYLQTLPRLVAEPVAALPVEWYPAAMAIAGAAIVTGCAFVVWRASAAQIENAYLRGALAAMVILLAVVGTETLANVTNSIWFLLFACFWTLLWRPASLSTAIGAGLLVFLVAVTNVGVAFLLPLWLLRLVAIRDRRDLVVVVAFAIGLAVQLGFSWNEIGQRGLAGDDATPGFPAGVPLSIEPYWDWDLVPAFAQRIVGGAVAGQAINGYLWEQLGAAFVIALGAGALTLVGVALADRRTRILVPLAVLIALALFLVSGYQRWGAGGFFFLWPEGESNSNAAHYMVTPTLLVLSALFVWLDAGIGRGASAGRTGALQAGVAVFVVGSALASFSVGETTTRGSLPWSEALAAGRAECRDAGVTEVRIMLNKPPFDGFPLPISCGELE